MISWRQESVQCFVGGGDADVQVDMVCQPTGEHEQSHQGRILELAGDDAEHADGADSANARLALPEMALTIAQKAIASLAGQVERVASCPGARCHTQRSLSPGWRGELELARLRPT